LSTLDQLYFDFVGIAPARVEQLTQAGSNRIYYRFFSNSAKYPTLIGVEGTSKLENQAFFAMAKHFEAKRLNTPRVYAQSDDGMCYLQQDLGNNSLFDLIRTGRECGHFSPMEIHSLTSTIQQLAHFQVLAAQGLDFSICYPQPAFNERSVLWDLNYFKYDFLKTTQVEFQEDLLEDDFQRMAQVLTKHADQPCFLYRDFQSRNVMWYEGQPYFIDFQGGRRGPITYDVVSFLWQAKANLSDALRRRLINAYKDEMQRIEPAVLTDFEEQLPHFVLFRTLQVLGAYGFRGYFERKKHFLESIPFAIDNLQQLMATYTFIEYPHLMMVLQQVILQFHRLPKQNMKPTMVCEPLTVTIYSFSYKKGVPIDLSGHGGGYVFDCRSTHNPGRYEQYKEQTGLDQPVIDFLEQDGEICAFLEHAYALVDHHVERFLERKFTQMQVAFGCTGGQHRSVYSAEHLAMHLFDKYPVRIHLIHRECGIDRCLS